MSGWNALKKLFIVAMGLALVGCTGGNEGASLAQRTCERLDECNSLQAGKSIEDCSQEVQHNLDGLAPNVRHDTEKLINDCLEFETCSVFLDCAGSDSPGMPPAQDPPPTTPPPTNPPPQEQSGRFTFTWAIERAGVPLSCGDVGAATVQLHSFLNGTEFLDVFDCAAFRGTTDKLPVGAYSIFITINDANNAEMGRSQSQTATVIAGQVVAIQGAIWQVE